MHARGRRARQLIEEARERLAVLFGAEARQVFFTSGGTESNNLAIRGAISRNPELQLITSPIEHASVLAAADLLERQGCEVIRLPVDSSGQPDFSLLARLSASRPSLVSLGWANGESGQVLDLEGLLASVQEGTLLHLDAAQAAGRIAVGLYEGISMVSCSCHKFGGPAGCGVLVLGRDAIDPVLVGGPQERGRRPGTENIAGIVGSGVAAKTALECIDREAARLGKLRERLWRGLSRALPNLRRVSPIGGLPNTLTVALQAPASDVMVAGLDLEGYCVSTGSACATASPEPSHVMKALGLESPYLSGVVRISMGWSTAESEVDGLTEAFVRVATRAMEAA